MVDKEVVSPSSSKCRIFVSGASGIVGYGILRSLRGLGDVQLIGSSIYPMSPANVFADEFALAPRTTDATYLGWLAELIKDRGIDVLIPGIEIDMEVWNANRKMLSEIGAMVLLNNGHLIDLCLDKWRFYRRLVEAMPELAIRTQLSPDGFDFPMLLKPRRGFGAKGIRIVRSQAELDEVSYLVGSELMVQEIVGDDDSEYTISGFFNSEGELRALFQLRRHLSHLGYTEYAETVDMPEMRGIITTLAKEFNPVGPTNFQFRRTADGWKLLEINPRISSATSIKTAFGYNECRMAIDYFIYGKEIVQPKLRSGKAMRYMEDHITYDSSDI